MDKLLPRQLFRMRAKIKEMTENSYKPFLRSSKLLGEADLIKKANFKGNNTSQICGSFSYVLLPYDTEKQCIVFYIYKFLITSDEKREKKKQLRITVCLRDNRLNRMKQVYIDLRVNTRSSI